MMSPAKNIAELRESIEESFLKDFKAEQPTDIYFELAAILAPRAVFLDIDRNALGIADANQMKTAEKDAQASLAYSIGYRACALDFANGNQDELEKLMVKVRGW